MKGVKYNKLEKDQRRVLDEAAKAMETAYNPYSNFCVGAAILTQKGEIITGSNVENAAYGPTICAERSAIVRANAMGIRKFSKIAVIAKGKDFDTTKITAPCGVCRQTLYEFAQVSKVDLEIIMSTTKRDEIIIAKISELLPLAFGPKDLGIDITRFSKTQIRSKT